LTIASSSKNPLYKMLLKKSMFFVMWLVSIVSFAQNTAIDNRVKEIEKSKASVAFIAELKKMLSDQELKMEEVLVVKTALIHQYQNLQQWDTCLHYCQQEVAMAHRQKNTLAEATFYKLIGNTYYYIPEKDRAVEYWNHCIEISEANHYNTLLEQCYHNVGAIYLEKGKQFDLAEKYLQKALTMGLSNHASASPDNNQHRRLLATLYERTSKLDKAENLYLEVIKNYKEAKDTLGIAETMMFYSEVLAKKKDFKKALQTSGAALEISRKTKATDMICTALTLHANNLHLAGNYKEAYQYEKELNFLIQERFKGDLNSKISEAEAKFKTAETTHEKEVTILKSKKEKQFYQVSILGLVCVAGVALFYFNQKRKFSRKIEQLKMQQQVQEEKERLSRDLHDNLGSQLALLSNNIEHLATTHTKQQLVDNDITRLKNTSKQLLQTLRETIWILNKEEVQVQDFFDKLADYATRYLQSYPAIHLTIDENFVETKTLNANDALQLFRICQEAINNACKYSGSDSIIIKGQTSGNEMQILIEDRGTGFDISAQTTNDHYGLRNMKQRADSIGALLKIHSVPEQGTLVTISFNK
jgi:signal transduction histidine kinase